MTKSGITVGAVAVVLAVVAVVAVQRVVERQVAPAPPSPAPGPAAGDAGDPAAPAAAADQGFLYGRVTATDGTAYEGRLRMGGGEEAFWSDHFNGAKEGNPWADHVAPAKLTERVPIEVFGLRLGSWNRRIDLRRPFMTRFGDVERIDADGRDLRVTLKSGTVVHLDRYGADDFADGVRVWDARHGAVDLGERRVRSIELLPTGRLEDAPARLRGTVHTAAGDAFTGAVQWNREHSVGSDVLAGVTVGGGRVALRFDTLRTIERQPPKGVRVTLRDGRVMQLSGSREAGDGHRGVFVDDPRYGRVLVHWSAFERLDLDAGSGGSGPAYGDFPPGRPLTGRVVTRDGRRLAGRLVYDLDESETTETLDAPAGGVNYSLPFALVAEIALPGGAAGGGGNGDERARVTLRDGTVLDLEPAGDLGSGNAGLLVFVDGEPEPAYVRWAEVAGIALDHPPAIEVPLGGL